MFVIYYIKLFIININQINNDVIKK
jgi:hypothetical protein